MIVKDSFHSQQFLTAFQINTCDSLNCVYVPCCLERFQIRDQSPIFSRADVCYWRERKRRNYRRADGNLCLAPTSHIKPTSSAAAPKILLLKLCRIHEWSETAWTAKTDGGDCVSRAAWPYYLPPPRSVTGIVMAEFHYGHWLHGWSRRDFPHWWGQKTSSL